MQSQSQTRATRRQQLRRALRRSGPWLATIVVAVLAVSSDAMIIQAALVANAPKPCVAASGKTPQSGDCTNDGSAQLIAGAQQLSTDALEILVPVVSLASGIGGIMWALGSQRGQGIVIGALVAGAAAVMIKTIVA
jgi:hypothetical protein